MPTNFTPVLRSLSALILWLGLTRPALAQTETFSSGSYIINMGITPQTATNGLKPYGLIYDLLKNNKVPIKWVISPTKAKDGTDFTYNGVQYKGGTFIIPAEYRNAAVNTKITGYGVTGTTTTSPLTVDVTYTLTAAPKWTLDDQNGAIAEGFFTQAGIPASSYNYKDPQTLAGCDDIFVMPHADPTWATHSNLYNWNRNSFGAIWAGCHAVSVLENMNNGSLQTNFLAVNVGAIGNALVPFGSHDDATPPYTHQKPNIAGAQYMGLTDAAHLNGSEQVFLPKPGGGWRPTTDVIAFDPTPKDAASKYAGQAALIVTGRGFGLTTAGRVMYEAGHDIKKDGGTASVAAIRAFFDFSFQSSIDKVPFISAASVPASMQNSTTYPVSITAMSPVGLSFTYQWTSSCGGTFANATAAATTFTAPNVGTVTTCVITCTVTDACGRQTFSSLPTTILPCNQSVTSTITPLCAGAANTGAIAMSVTGGVAPYSYTWTRSGGGSGSGAGTTISGLAAGTYTVTITSSNGCATTFTVTVGTFPAIVITDSPIAVLCNGASTGGINLSVSGGTPGYTYNWGGGITTQNRSGLSAGTYSVTVTDSKGCTANKSITLTQPTALSVVPTATPVNCFGQSTGAIALSVSGGTGPYTYLWSNGATVANPTGLTAGTYSVTVTDAKGCTVTGSWTVNQPSPLVLSLVKVDPTCPPPSAGDGSINLTVTGGNTSIPPAAPPTNPYTYAWTTVGGSGLNPTAQNQTGLSAGTYTVVVTDLKGCNATSSVTLTNLNPNPVAPGVINNY